MAGHSWRTSWRRGPLARSSDLSRPNACPDSDNAIAGSRISRQPDSVVQSGSAVLTESKRFPLVWPLLRTPLPTWQSLLPETRDPRDAPWLTDDSWLLKSAYCNTGDTVTVPRCPQRMAINPAPYHLVSRHMDRPAAVLDFTDLDADGANVSLHRRIHDRRTSRRNLRQDVPRAIIDFAAIDVVVLVTREGMPDQRKKHSIFRAPSSALWSPWVKPTLFAHMSHPPAARGRAICS